MTGGWDGRGPASGRGAAAPHSHSGSGTGDAASLLKGTLALGLGHWQAAGFDALLLTFGGGGSSFNDGTTQTALDPLGRGPVRTQ